MANAVPRTRFDDGTELLGVPKARSLGDRFDLEVANYLVAKRSLKLTELAVALRQKAEWGSTLAQTVISLGFIRPIDYYRTVAEVYGLPFVNLQQEPIDETLVKIDDRLDYADRGMIPWRTVNGKVVLAATTLTAAHIEWADARYGLDNY